MRVRGVRLSIPIGSTHLQRGRLWAAATIVFQTTLETGPLQRQPKTPWDRVSEVDSELTPLVAHSPFLQSIHYPPGATPNISTTMTAVGTISTIVKTCPPTRIPPTPLTLETTHISCLARVSPDTHLSSRPSRFEGGDNEKPAYRANNPSHRQPSLSIHSAPVATSTLVISSPTRSSLRSCHRPQKMVSTFEIYF